jgi:hypothetical protein
VEFWEVDMIGSETYLRTSWAPFAPFPHSKVVIPSQRNKRNAFSR